MQTKFTSFSLLFAGVLALASCSTNDADLPEPVASQTTADAVLALKTPADSVLVLTKEERGFTIQTSDSSARTNRRRLAGTLSQGAQYIFVPKAGVRNTGVREVKFYLNNVLVRTETSAPFDLQGTASNRQANPLLAPATPTLRTVRAEVTSISGATYTLVTKFTHRPE